MFLIILFFLLTWYRKLYLNSFLENIPSESQEPINEKVLLEMISDGRILLILDGLDELARIQGEQCVETLKHEISRLVKGKNPKIIIACRDHILHRLIKEEIMKDSDKSENISLSPVEKTVIKRHLGDIEIADEALQIIANTPLFYSVLFTTLETEKHGIGVIRTKADFWQMWVQMASNSCDESLNTESMLKKLGNLATTMLDNRTDFLNDSDLGDYHKMVEQLGQSKCPVFVKESNNKWRFIHQAIREYSLVSPVMRKCTDSGHEKCTVNF